MKQVLVFILFFKSITIFGQDAFAKAELLYDNKEYAKAKEAFTSIYATEPNNLDVLERLGDIAGHEKNYKTAMEYYEKIVIAKPSDAQYNFKYGGSMGLYAKGESKMTALKYIEDIKKHLKKAASLDRNHIESRHALSQLYCQLPGIIGGSIKTARGYASELMAISPVDGYLALGYIEAYLNNNIAAEKAYKNAVAKGGSVLCYSKLAEFYEKNLKQYKNALATLRNSYEIHKDSTTLEDIKRIKSKYKVY